MPKDGRGVKRLKRVPCIFAVIIFALMLVAPVLAFDIPNPTNAFYVNDFAGVIDSSTEQYILNRAVPLQQKTGAQVVVVTINTIDGEPLEETALGILRGWGIGDREKNNGVLILLVVNDRLSRIEVGYGLEGALPDGKTGRIQDEYMVPYFAEGNYSMGLKLGFQAIINEVYKEYNIDEEITQIYPPQPEQGSDPVRAFGGIIVLILLLIDWIFLRGSITRFLILMFLSNRGGRGGSGGRGGFGGGGFGGGGFRGGGGSGGGGGSSRRW